MYIDGAPTKGSELNRAADTATLRKGELMNTHYLVEEGQVIARGIRAELAPLETANRHVVFAPDWELGISWLQDPKGETLDLLRDTYADDEPVDLLAWHEVLDGLNIAH